MLYMKLVKLLLGQSYPKFGISSIYLLLKLKSKEGSSKSKRLSKLKLFLGK